MKGETRERWQQLCAQAADEQDHNRLMELVHEITRLLDEKQHRLSKSGETQKIRTVPESNRETHAE